MNDIEDNFCITLSAPRKSGKSYLVGKMLKSGLADRFDHIFILSPTLEFNDDYLEFENNQKFRLISNVDSKTVDEIFEAQAKCMRKVKANNRKRKRQEYETNITLKCPQSLVILDDCLDSGVLDFRGAVDKLAERGRHIKLSGIIIGQRMSGVSRSVRINSDLFIIFNPYSISELEQYLEQFVSRSQRKDLRRRIIDIFHEPYTFLILDNNEKDHSKKMKISNADDFIRGKVEYLNLNTE